MQRTKIRNPTKNQERNIANEKSIAEIGIDAGESERSAVATNDASATAVVDMIPAMSLLGRHLRMMMHPTIRKVPTNPCQMRVPVDRSIHRGKTPTKAACAKATRRTDEGNGERDDGAIMMTMIISTSLALRRTNESDTERSASTVRTIRLLLVDR